MSKTYENIRKIATGKGDDYTTGCLLDYPYFKDNYKMIAIDLSKQQALDADPRKFNKLISQQTYIVMELLQCSLLSNREKKLFLNFRKEQ